jgi:cytochrome c553
MKRLIAQAVGVCLLSFAAASMAASGNVAAGKNKSGRCAGCHGMDGNSVNPQWPKLAGQVEEYLFKQLQDYKSGARKNATMTGMVASLSSTDMQDLAAYFASRKITPGAVSDVKSARWGEKIYRGGNAKTGVSACMSCHGPTGLGIPPRFPRVSGQHTGYTIQQLMDFKRGQRLNDGEVMKLIAFRMSEAEIKAVSEYMAGLRKAE